MNKQLVNYDYIISIDNLLATWQDFSADKKTKSGIQEFSLNLMDNIFNIHHQLTNFTYHHDNYSTFHIYDPKHRIISKASVKDRLVHHLVFNELYRIFNPTFIHHSYSSRIGKGTHIAVKDLFSCLRKVSNNYTQTIHILKCDIKKFFWSMDHQKLLFIIQTKVKDEKFLWLINEIIQSFSSLVDKNRERELNIFSTNNKGVPIGNVTSQIFANIYLNELDQYIKHQLKIKHYFRYADDFVIIHQDKKFLQNILPQIGHFLQEKLLLRLHSRKVSIKKFSQGADFLGYVILPHYITLRTKTKKRMFRKIKESKAKLNQELISEDSFNQSLQSYYGILKHCNGYKLKRKLDEVTKNF